jgi:RimJ/RimL family protein N-acetyltransferase
MELKGGRILLRDFEERDVGVLLAIHSDPRVLRYYAPEVGTPEHARMLVEMFIRWANEQPRQNFQFAIVDLETNALLGSCGIRRKDCPPGQAEFGIGIGADWWGKEIAQEAARTILRFGFSELDLHKSMAWPCLRTKPSRSSRGDSGSTQAPLGKATPGWWKGTGAPWIG